MASGPISSVSQSVSSVAQSCPTLRDPMNCRTPGLPVHHELLEFTQTHVHRVGDAIQPSHPLSSLFPPAPNPSQHHITSLQIDGETMETVRDFIFSGSKIIADGDCSHEIKRSLLLGRKVMTNLDSVLKSSFNYSINHSITLPTKVHLVKAMVFPVVMCQEAFNRRLPVCSFGSVMNPLSLINS